MSRQSLKVKEPRVAFGNVLSLVARRKSDGLIVARRSAKNIVVNQGRNWVRGLFGVSSFVLAPDVAGAYPGQAGSPWTVDQALSSPFNNFRLRYMALGSGGMFAAGGSFQESAHVATLEESVPLNITEDLWLKEMLPSSDANDAEVFPTAYDFVARCIWDSEDLSYDIGVEPEISEICICTSQSDPLANPDLLANPVGGFPGMVAYNCFAPITKTQDILLEAFWYWRV